MLQHKHLQNAYQEVKKHTKEIQKINLYITLPAPPRIAAKAGVNTNGARSLKIPIYIKYRKVKLLLYRLIPYFHLKLPKKCPKSI
jgi:hypothetical protein